MVTTSECILRISDVKMRTGISRSSIYAKINQGTFPKPINLGVRSVGWLESEINAWIADRINESRNNLQTFCKRTT